jgi:tol-pal system-associated acyl-CoA thioesterase
LATAIKLNHGQFDWAIRVYYEDTDSGGVVYHSNYLNFMERARTEWLRHLGFEQTYLKDVLNVIFVVHSMQIAFKKPAKFNDLLVVTSEISKIGRGSFEFLQKISINQLILIEAQVKIACVDALSFKPTAIPEKIRLTMEQT